MPRPSLREQLLSAGLETLHRKGFNATSVQDITDAAGAPKGSFYNHFESKEALAAEAVRRYVERAKARRMVLRDESVAPLKRLRRYWEGVCQAAIEAKFSHGCLLGNFGAELSGQSAPIRKQVDHAFALWREEIAAVVAEAQKAGEVPRKFAAAELAEFIIDAWEGAVLRAKVAKDRAPLDLFLEMVFGKILA